MAEFESRRQHKLTVEFGDLRAWIAEKRGVTIPALWYEAEITTNADGEGAVQIAWAGPWEPGEVGDGGLDGGGAAPPA
jgi:hypothetical protein